MGGIKGAEGLLRADDFVDVNRERCLNAVKWTSDSHILGCRRFVSESVSDACGTSETWGSKEDYFFLTAESSSCSFGSRRLCFVALQLLTDRLTMPRPGLDMRLVCDPSSAGT